MAERGRWLPIRSDRHRAALAAVAISAALVAGACGGSVDGSDADGASARSDEVSGDVGDAGGGPGDGSDVASGGTAGSGPVGGAAEGTRAVSLATAGRSVVSTGALEVEVTDLVAATARAVALTEASGGEVFAETSAFREERRSVLTLKVPPEEFRSLLAGLAELGTAVSQDVSTEEVTERVVDLESRITTSEASIARLRGYLEGAADVESLARLEAELLARETDLEAIRGQLRTLEDRIERATIVVNLVEVGTEAAGNEATGLWAAFEDGLGGGWDALMVSTTAALVVAGALLPWLPLAVVAAVGWRLARRANARISARTLPRASA